MNAYLPFDSAALWQLAGWTMVHFLWLGAAAAALALLCRLVLRNAAPNIRYTAALSCLLLISAMPLAIATWLATENSPPLKGGARGGTEIPNLDVVAANIERNEIIELNENRAPDLTPPPTTVVDDDIINPSPTPTKPSTNHVQTATRFSFVTLQQFVPYLPWLWLIGTPITFALLAMGVVGTKRLRQSSRNIDDSRSIELLTRACTALNVRARVGLAVCDRIATPVLIGILRPMILLPPAALTGWSPDEIEMVLLHELAHVRRWDNLVNLLQRCIESLLFFHPAVWIISTWVRREREDCCDAIVVRRTERPHAYAELLVALAAQMSRSVLFHPVASSAMSSGPLHSRIRRILQLESDPMLISGKSFAIMLASILAAATFTVLYVPTIGQAEESATSSIEIDGVKLASLEREIADDPDKFATAHLPYAVQYEQGASRFLDGDNITILDVRGTSRTFEPGNVYQIKGKYTLGSRDSARLAAFTTAKKTTDGTGPVWKIQAANVDRGEGTFTLFLPMSHNGWPHISFYPQSGGDNFGGTYFGTDDSVLKKWWKSGEVIDQTTKEAAEESAHEEDASTNWLKETHFATAEDRDVAKRAWKELGVKFVPASNRELAHIHAGGTKGGLKALDLEDTLNVKPPVIFTHFQSRQLSTGIPDFKTLNKALDALVSGRDGGIVVLQGINKGGGVIQYSIRWPLEYETDAPSHPKFPSLEDQKLADVAFKRLNLELEPIGDDDLKRVRALGYDGGVKVVSVTASISTQQEQFLTGDILVGLHVWPTTSLANIAEILQRDDIAELNPLKFYVVRIAPSQDDLFAGGPPTQDHIVTGRISVNLGSSARVPVTASDPPLTAADESERVIYFFHSQNSAPCRKMKLIVDRLAKEWLPTRVTEIDVGQNAELATAMNIDKVPSILVLRNGRVLRHLVGLQNEKELDEAIRSAVSPSAETATQKPRSSLVTDTTPYVLPSPEDEDTRPKSRRARPTAPGSDAEDGAEQRINTPIPTAVRTDSTTKESLRYDDKTFDQWRGLWKNELSNSKRSEAVKALAAFARAGYGNEAIEVILEVAGEYDFFVLSSVNETPVQQAVVDELAPESGDDVLAKYWVPELAVRLKNDPKKWKWLAYWSLSRLRTDDATVVPILRSFAAEGSSEVRSAALNGLLESNKWQHKGQLVLDDQTRKLVADALQSNDNQIILAILGHLLRRLPSEAGRPVDTVLIFQPELVPLLFHEDEHLQRNVRGVIRHIAAEDAPEVVEQLVAELNDDAQTPEHRLAAIRALAAIGNKAASAIPALQQLVAPTTDKSTLMALYFAMQRIAEKSNDDVSLFDIFTQDFDKDQKDAVREKLDEKTFQKSLARESEATLPPDQHFGGGGGGFF